MNIAGKRKKLRKLRHGGFTWDDLSGYVQKRVVENGQVYALKLGKWVRINNTQVLLKARESGHDDSHACIVARPNRTGLNWLLLPLAKFFDKGEWVHDWDKLSNTEIIIDIWYSGVRIPGTFLAALAK